VALVWAVRQLAFAAASSVGIPPVASLAPAAAPASAAASIACATSVSLF